MNENILAEKPWGVWWIAARPKTLTAITVPVVVGTLLAHSIDWVLAGLTLACAIFVQIGINLFNDALDFKRGADTKERLGFIRVTERGLLSPGQVMTGAVVCYGIAALCGIPLIMQGGPVVCAFLLLSFTFGYFYTGGPYPLAYYGLGELFVILFFGWLSTMIGYFLQTGFFSWTSFVAGTQVGLLSTAMIATNNLRDIEGDARANKQTLAVRYGKAFARAEISLLSLFPFLLGFYWFYAGYLLACALPFIVLPLSIRVLQSIWQTEPGRVYNEYFFKTCIIHLLFGLMLAAGLYMH